MGRERGSGFARPDLTVVSVRPVENDLAPAERQKLCLNRRNFVVDFFQEYMQRNPVDAGSFSTAASYVKGLASDFFEARNRSAGKIDQVNLRTIFMETDFGHAVEVLRKELAIFLRLTHGEIYSEAQIAGFSKSVAEYLKYLMTAKVANNILSNNRRIYLIGERQKVKQSLHPVPKSA
ncbi:hypothetical protein HY382_00870 [Candidatus Curtissbacteria bacterium]|nr:hypothetical protein [Candidatus Curtissbacteria bacterium]